MTLHYLVKLEMLIAYVLSLMFISFFQKIYSERYVPNFIRIAEFYRRYYKNILVYRFLDTVYIHTHYGIIDTLFTHAVMKTDISCMTTLSMQPQSTSNKH